MRNVPVEITETIAPVVIWKKEYRQDSGGPGAQRGGLGQVMEVEHREGAPFGIFATFERVKHPARGRDGGKAGGNGRLSLASGQELRAKGFQTIPAGERLVVEMPGGGGFGDPAKRDRAQVERDVRLGLVSKEKAKADYGVGRLSGLNPSIVALDPSFKRYHLALSAVERLYHGTRWGEGPVWLGDARCLLWSDIPNNRVLKWDEETGAVSAWRKPSNNANGHTRDRQGRIVACEHGGRRVVRFEYDGVDHRAGQPLPGQAAEQPERRGGEVGRLGLVHRPALRPLRLLRGREGRARELPHTNVYRVDGATGEITLVADDVDHPNGLAFSPDEKHAVRHREPSRAAQHPRLRRGWRDAANRRVFVACKPGETPDGFRVDVDGNLWCGWGMTAGVRRRARVQRRRRADRAYPPAGTLRERRLRRAAPQPAVHGGGAVAVCLYVNTQGAPGG